MKKKQYITPVLEITEFETEDVITTSDVTTTETLPTEVIDPNRTEIVPDP